MLTITGNMLALIDTRQNVLRQLFNLISKEERYGSISVIAPLDAEGLIVVRVIALITIVASVMNNNRPTTIKRLHKTYQI